MNRNDNCVYYLIKLIFVNKMSKGLVNELEIIQNSKFHGPLYLLKKYL